MDALKHGYPGLVQVRVPERVPAMIAATADRKCTTPSEYVRRAIVAQLTLDGVDLSTGAPATPALSLWLEQPAEGKQFALVDGDIVVDYALDGAPVGDKRTWLPLVFADSQPFDPGTMYRETPYLKRDGDRVLRIYPIRLKSASHFAGDK